MAFRQERLESQIKNLAAQFLEANATSASLITVTGCAVSPDTKRATILISVLPKSKENAAYGFAKRNLGEMRTFIQKHLHAQIPYLDVAIDQGEKNRQLVDDILREDGALPEEE